MLKNFKLIKKEMIEIALERKSHHEEAIQMVKKKNP